MCISKLKCLLSPLLNATGKKSYRITVIHPNCSIRTVKNIVNVNVKGHREHTAVAVQLSSKEYEDEQKKDDTLRTREVRRSGGKKHRAQHDSVPSYYRVRIRQTQRNEKTSLRVGSSTHTLAQNSLNLFLARIERALTV